MCVVPIIEKIISTIAYKRVHVYSDMQSEYLGKRSHDWGVSPELDYSESIIPQKRRRIQLRPFMLEACWALQLELGRWHEDQMVLLDGHQSKGEAIRPHFYRFYAQLKGLLEQVEEEYSGSSTDEVSPRSWTSGEDLL